MLAIPQFASSTLTEVSFPLYALSYIMYLQYYTDSVSLGTVNTYSSRLLRSLRLCLFSDRYLPRYPAYILLRQFPVALEGSKCIRLPELRLVLDHCCDCLFIPVPLEPAIGCVSGTFRIKAR